LHQIVRLPGTFLPDILAESIRASSYLIVDMSMQHKIHPQYERTAGDTMKPKQYYCEWSMKAIFLKKMYQPTVDLCPFTSHP
jgi:hypothetical protein